MTTSPSPSGRPRDAAREQAILDAALALLVDVGYEQLTIDAVAARARASKATIYRRWAGKQELIVAAMQRYAREEPADSADLGSLRAELIVQCRRLADMLQGFDGGLILGLTRAARHSPELGDALEKSVGPSGARLPQALIDRAIARGDLPAGTSPDIFEEVAGSVLIARVITGQPTDDDYLEHLVDDVLLPALRAEANRPPKQASRSVPAL